MIPPIVFVTAQGHEQHAIDTLTDLVYLLKHPELPIPFDVFMGSLEKVLNKRVPHDRLLPLAVRPLVPTERTASAVSEFLTIIEPKQLVRGMKSLPDALSVKAGLFLVNDYLQSAHAVAQAADEAGRNTSAAYWHGIMHRREPDYDNARYWFRRVGDHPIFPEIGREVGELLSEKDFADRLRFPRVLDRRGHWDAMAFIDLCEECGRNWDQRAQAAARLQEVELRRLLEYTCKMAQAAT